MSQLQHALLNSSIFNGRVSLTTDACHVQACIARMLLIPGGTTSTLSLYRYDLLQVHKALSSGQHET